MARPPTPPHESVVRVSSSDRAALDFKRLHSLSNGLGTPVLFEGLFSGTHPVQHWTLDSMFGLRPESEVDAEYYADADRRKPYVHVTKSFEELAELMRADPEKWFLAERDLDETFPDAAAELEPLLTPPSGAKGVIRLVFFGTNSQSATHFHVRDQAVLVHLRGHKKVVLAGPDCTRMLATNSAFGGRPQFSVHGPKDGADALDTFRALVGDRASMVEMAPGDALFIPVHWWHWVEGKGECLSVTTFWRASLRDWAFPAPGLRSAIAVVLSELASFARSVPVHKLFQRSRPHRKPDEGQTT